MKEQNLKKPRHKIRLFGTKLGRQEAGLPYIIRNNSRFDIIEAYKSTRTNIMYSMVGGESNVICLTSPSSTEGKTTNCINLAITFAQTGARVLLIDADMRKPRVHRCLKLNTDHGLSNVLGGFSDLYDAIQRTAYDNLDVLVCGHIPPNPAELLASEKMSAILDVLKKEYDYILLDTPPVNAVTDVVVLSKYVRGIVLVARYASTTYEEMQTAINKLKIVDAKILGFILNEIGERAGYYRNHYKKYKYQYAEEPKKQERRTPPV